MADQETDWAQLHEAQKLTRPTQTPNEAQKPNKTQKPNEAQKRNKTQNPSEGSSASLELTERKIVSAQCHIRLDLGVCPQVCNVKQLLLFLFFFCMKHFKKKEISLVSHGVRLDAPTPVDDAGWLAPVLGPLGAGTATAYFLPHPDVLRHQRRWVGARGLGLGLWMCYKLTMAARTENTLAGWTILWLESSLWLDTKHFGITTSDTYRGTHLDKLLWNNILLTTDSQCPVGWMFIGFTTWGTDRSLLSLLACTAGDGAEFYNWTRLSGPSWQRSFTCMISPSMLCCIVLYCTVSHCAVLFGIVSKVTVIKHHSQTLLMDWER